MRDYTPDAFEYSLVEKLIDRAEQIYRSDDAAQKTTTAWTLALKKTFAAFASDRGQGIKCMYSSTPREFLWDVTIIATDPPAGAEWNIRSDDSLWRFLLAGEIEWGQRPQHPLEDFRKLLAASVQYRIMIFDRTKHDLFKRRVEAMAKVVPDTFAGRIIFLGIKNEHDPDPVSKICLVRYLEFGNPVADVHPSH